MHFDFTNHHELASALRAVLSGRYCRCDTDGPRDFSKIVFLPDVVQLVKRFRDFYYQNC